MYKIDKQKISNNKQYAFNVSIGKDNNTIMYLVYTDLFVPTLKVL